MKKHLELEIKILENAPRDADKLETPFASKTKTKGRSNAHRRYTKVGFRD